MLYNREDKRIQEDPLLRTKLQMLELAEESGNVSYACRRAGYSRDTFYRIRKLFLRGGIEALQHMSKGKPNLKNRVPASTEYAVLELAKQHPEFGQIRVSMMLVARGTPISAAGVRSVWLRHGLSTVERRAACSVKTLADVSNVCIRNDDNIMSEEMPRVA